MVSCRTTKRPKREREREREIGQRRLPLYRSIDRLIEDKMSVSLVRKVRLRVGAGVAKPGPAIGQALGPLGLNMAEFCKQFNEKTKLYEKDTPIPVDLSAFSNRSFTFVVKSPPTSWFLKKCAGVELGSARFGSLTNIASSSTITNIAKYHLFESC